MEKNKKRRTCLIVGLAIVVACLCLTVVLGGAGYYLYSSGQLDLSEISGWLGFGPGEIQVINLSDGEIEAVLTRINAEDGETYSEGDGKLAPYDIKTFRSLNGELYTLEINVYNGLPVSSSCTVKMKGGDIYRVVVVPEGTAITLEGENVTRVEEVNILTSPLCQP